MEEWPPLPRTTPASGRTASGRINELYLKAVEQLGAGQAPARLAGFG